MAKVVWYPPQPNWCPSSLLHFLWFSLFCCLRFVVNTMMVQSFKCLIWPYTIHKFSYNIPTTYKIHTTFKKIYWHFKNKNFVSKLPQEIVAMEIFEILMEILSIPLWRKMLWVQYKDTTIWRGNNTKFIHNKLQRQTCNLMTFTIWWKFYNYLISTINREQYIGKPCPVTHNIYHLTQGVFLTPTCIYRTSKI